LQAIPPPRDRDSGPGGNGGKPIFFAGAAKPDKRHTIRLRAPQVTRMLWPAVHARFFVKCCACQENWKES
jgi:hypothetical protein